ncbi:condensation domain-containing protein [Arthrobacter sp. AG258]|uniref:condensation domain-containing protein n=1 Tax=Arthrobacter sp. AG258 TaxID=2183899 RepID=UPI00105EEDAE|nr:condensation domain-containing protein [Arthrobacter sp. AG258]TDT81850.1 condensation domain-containing protein [Arthrobacter sp. AG258]
MFDQLQIKFVGEFGGESPMTWAQREQWQVQVATAPFDARLNPRFRMRLRSGTTLDSIQSALARLVERYEALRTTYPVVGTTPIQRIERSGTFHVQVWKAEDFSELSATAQLELESRSFELETEWPFRFGIVIDHSGHVNWLVGVVSHVSADAAAILLLRASLEDFLYGDASISKRSPLQPREQALFETSDAGRSVLKRSLSEWRSGLGEFDSLPRAGNVNDKNVVPFPSVTLFARGYGRRASHLAEELHIHQSVVYVAAAAAAVARALGVDAYALKVSCSNRRPTHGDYLGMLAQQGLIPLRLGQLSFRELARNVGRGMLGSYRSSRYDPDALCQQSSGKHGWYGSDDPVIDHWINYMPSAHAPAFDGGAGLKDGQFTIDESGSVDYTVVKFGFVVSPIGDDLSLRIFGNSHHLSRETMGLVLKENISLIDEAIESVGSSTVLS